MIENHAEFRETEFLTRKNGPDKAPLDEELAQKIENKQARDVTKMSTEELLKELGY